MFMGLWNVIVWVAWMILFIFHYVKWNFRYSTIHFKTIQFAFQTANNIIALNRGLWLVITSKQTKNPSIWMENVRPYFLFMYKWPSKVVGKCDFEIWVGDFCSVRNCLLSIAVKMKCLTWKGRMKADAGNLHFKEKRFSGMETKFKSSLKGYLKRILPFSRTSFTLHFSAIL